MNWIGALKRCPSLNFEYLWVWPYLETGPIRMIKLRLGHRSGLSSNDCVLNKHRKQTVWCRRKARWRQGRIPSTSQGMPGATNSSERRRWRGSPSHSRESSPARTLISEPLELWDSQFLRFKPLAGGVLLQSPRRGTHRPWTELSPACRVWWALQTPPRTLAAHTIPPWCELMWKTLRWG